MRKLLSQSQKQIDYENVVNQTGLILTLKELVRCLFVDQVSSDVMFAAYYMKLEVCWILANLFYSKEEVCMHILTDNENGQIKQSSIFEFLIRGLDGDMALLDLVTFNFANLVNDQGPCQFIVSQVNLISRFQKIVETMKLPKDVLISITSIIERVVHHDDRMHKSLLKKADRCGAILICKAIIADSEESNESFKSVLSAMKNITDNASDDILLIVGAGPAIERFIELHIKHFNEMDVHINLSRILANLCASSDSTILERLVYYGIFERLYADMILGTKDMGTEALWALSNIVADSSIYCKKLTDNKIFEKVIKMGRSNILRQRHEALIVLTHIAAGMNASEIMKIFLDY